MQKLNAVTGVLIAMVFAALALPAVQLIRQTREAKREQADTKRVFWRVNIIQYVAIVVAIILLNIFHGQAYIVPAIAIIVGLHLFPLARLFHYRPHFVTGALLIIWPVLTILLLRPERIQSSGALGIAGILLLSAAYTLIVAFRAFRRFQL